MNIGCRKNGCISAVVALLLVAHQLASAAAPISAYDRVWASGFESIPTYYVATNGSNSNPGTRAAPWKTITYAVDGSPAPAGSTIYVAAGTYNEAVNVKKNGISLIGYKTEPGDQPLVLANVPIDMGDDNPFPAFDPSEMPLLDYGDRSNGYGFLVQGRRDVSIRNFNIRNTKYGVSAGNSGREFAENLSLDNVNASTLGSATSGYSGLGIALGSISNSFSNGSYVRNALIINAAAEGFKINGSRNVAKNIRVYSTEDGAVASTDYFVVITGGDYNVIRDSLIWRQPDSVHNGHGYTIKDNADQLSGGPLIKAMYNLFQNNVAYNVGEGYVVRHRGVQQNTFLDNSSYGTASADGDCGEGNGILIRDGASGNVFKNTIIQNVYRSIKFTDTEEDGGSLETPANDNIIESAQVYNACEGVAFIRDMPKDTYADAGDNLITESNFVRVKTLFTAARPANQMRYSNTSFSGTAGLGIGGAFRTGTYANTVVPSQFTNCTFENVVGGVPPGF